MRSSDENDLRTLRIAREDATKRSFQPVAILWRITMIENDEGPK
jgi:hypothetical protein